MQLHCAPAHGKPTQRLNRRDKSALLNCVHRGLLLCQLYQRDPDKAHSEPNFFGHGLFWQPGWRYGLPNPGRARGHMMLIACLTTHGGGKQSTAQRSHAQVKHNFSCSTIAHLHRANPNQSCVWETVLQSLRQPEYLPCPPVSLNADNTPSWDDGQ